MNISEKFQLIPHKASEELIFEFLKFRLLVAMTTKQIEMFGQKVNV